MHFYEDFCSFMLGVYAENHYLCTIIRKIVQGECRASSLLESYVEPQPILYKQKQCRQ